MLTIEHLTKKYHKTVACDDISFTLEPGTITVLLGPNGAGKSTVIKSILGFLKHEGQILVNGYENSSEEAKQVLGYVPEIPSLYPNLTVAEHLEFIARAYKLKNYQEYATELLDRFELSDKKKKFGDELSKGMQQKLNICCGLLPHPEIILFDEPMIGLDPHAIKELKLMFDELRKSGATLLVSTHMIDSIDLLWDRTIILQRGKMRANVTRGELEGLGESLEDLFFAITEGESEPEEAPVPTAAKEEKPTFSLFGKKARK